MLCFLEATNLASRIHVNVKRGLRGLEAEFEDVHKSLDTQNIAVAAAQANMVIVATDGSMPELSAVLHMTNNANDSLKPQYCAFGPNRQCLPYTSALTLQNTYLYFTPTAGCLGSRWLIWLRQGAGPFEK
jgi:hypothetical protein